MFDKNFKQWMTFRGANYTSHWRPWLVQWLDHLTNVSKGRGSIPHKEHWHRLLGLRNEAKKFNPEILLTMRVEENVQGEKYSQKRMGLIPYDSMPLFIDHCNAQGSAGERIESKVQTRFDVDLSLIAPSMKTQIDVAMRMVYKGEIIMNKVGMGLASTTAPPEKVVSHEIPTTPTKDDSAVNENSLCRPTSPTVLEKSPLQSPKDLPIMDVCAEVSPSIPVKEKWSNIFEEVGVLETRAAFEEKEFTKEKAFKICEELEDWKEQQQEMFKDKLKRKIEKHLEKLSSAWAERQKEIEDDFTKKMEKNKEERQSLSEATMELHVRIDSLKQKELELDESHKKLRAHYAEKLQELREASLSYQRDMEQKIAAYQKENLELFVKLDLLEKNNRKLEKEVARYKSYEDQLTSDHTSNLISDMKYLEEKLEVALDSKAFFKEQWGKAVREIHRLKEEQECQIKLQIEKSKEGLENLGLVDVCMEEENQMKEDITILKGLKHEFLEYCDLIKNRGRLNRDQVSHDAANSKIADLNGISHTLPP
ncbi:hypothetical protein AAG570_006787 [Ranatra chinensis]|uniref:Uncharacterized protein n=1 Tax=Ranatra chinensis TaxID=642074 RepID=A0ABD0YVC3_9HEMI